MFCLNYALEVNPQVEAALCGSGAGAQSSRDRPAVLIRAYATGHMDVCVVHFAQRPAFYPPPAQVPALGGGGGGGGGDVNWGNPPGAR